MLNDTLNYLYAHSSLAMLCFSGQTGSVSVNLNGPGGLSGDGFPLPASGLIRSLRLWDGTSDHTDTDEIPVTAGDRLSIYCQNVGSDFTVKLRLNGSSTDLEIAGIAFNSPLFASVAIQLNRD